MPLPADAALPAGSSTTRGMLVRTVQAPVDATVANSYLRAVRQLNGVLADGSGTPYANEATPGSGADGAHSLQLINLEKGAAPFDVINGDGSTIASFAPDLFPGIPGSGGHTDNFVTEVVAYLDLSAGEHVFGVSSATDRTDVNDDDSWQLFVGKNPRSVFNTKVAEFARSAPPFQGNTHSETQFTLTAPVAGIYPVRLLHWQTTRGSNLQFYTVLSETERLFVNDPTDTRAIKAYTDTSVADSRAPFVSYVTPQAGSAGNGPDEPIEAYLGDATTTVVASSVKLFLNNVQVPAVVTKTGRQTRVFYDPDTARTNPVNAMRLDYQDSVGVTRSASWSFGITVVGGSSTVVAGQWDFDAGDLSATVGQALAYFDGPAGLTAAGTRFGTTTALGVPDIAGQEAKVMEIPGDLKRQIGYVMTHGIAPNGGGTRVNQFTLIMDVLIDTGGPGAASLLQVNSLDNTDDGDLFWQGNNFGQGTNGYVGTGAFTPGTWHRVVAAYDLAATPPVVTKYVDCIKQDDWTFGQSLDNDRRALKPTAILFGDGDQDERRKMWVNSIQIRSGKLKDAEIVALGGVSAAGIPRVLPAVNVAGQWDFNQGSLGATVGKALQYFDGPGGSTQLGTQFGLCSELGVPLINGVDARVMRIPGDLSRSIGYIMDHGIAPNGGGARVNRFTLLFDLFVASSGPGAASLLQINSLDNTDDGDLFWQGNNFGQGTNGYVGTGAFTAGAWHRVIAAYDLAATPPVVTKFVDGIKQDDWTFGQSLDADRRALKPTAILFGDGDQDERREMWVDSIQIRSAKLSDAEMTALGTPTGYGLPVIVPDPNASAPVLTISRDSATTLRLSWTTPAGHAAPPVLETSLTLDSGSWTTVPTTGNSVTLPMEERQTFWRLRY